MAQATGILRCQYQIGMNAKQVRQCIRPAMVRLFFTRYGTGDKDVALYCGQHGEIRARELRFERRKVTVEHLDQESEQR